jgi:Uma2 family endonuclease
MADAAKRQRMTVEEFLAWDDGTGTRYELIDGVPVAMAPPSDPHGTIAVNVAVEIDRRLQQRPPCRAITEAGIRQGEHDHYEADVAVTCAELRRLPYHYSCRAFLRWACCAMA